MSAAPLLYEVGRAKVRVFAFRLDQRPERECVGGAALSGQMRPRSTKGAEKLKSIPTSIGASRCATIQSAMAVRDQGRSSGA